MDILSDSVEINIKALKNNVSSGQTTAIKWRILQINKINTLINENKNQILKSLKIDLGKSKIEALSEILLIQEEILLVKKNLRFWMRPKTINVPIYLFPASSKIIYEPLGCVLIIGPYNYPFLYTFKPLVNIFSAGNTAVLKPSEKCPKTSELISKLTKKYFTKDILCTVEGGLKTSRNLIKENFDHIFFTGSTETGKSIMKSASKNLTPLTLELSGTNPVIVFKNANLKIAAKRIVWGKFFNSGQSCVAPNHIFVAKEIEHKFIEEIIKCIYEFYGRDPIKSENLSKLEKGQFKTTLKLLKRFKKSELIIHGGIYDKKELKISPTIIKIKSENEKIINKEMFSSLLPVMSINNIENTVNIIQKANKPLVIYIFGGTKNNHRFISKVTSSGSICINDVILPVLIPNLSFGGVGKSGMGRFHGEEGFKNFSNSKSYIQKNTFLDVNLRYPPYEKILKLINYIFNI